VSESRFSQKVLDWFARHGRKDLPWQVADPYAVWVSEIMLQQTQVAKVLDYYARFMVRFPTLQALADAHEDQVLALWSGLGYYNRARYLHQAARQCQNEFNGALPASLADLMRLPGIGRSTAGAILSLTGQCRVAILDGNVKRLFARHFEVDGDPGRSATVKTLWALAEKHLPERYFDRYNQALMDLGASVCTRHSPRCGDCPLQDSCGAYRHGRVNELPQKKRAVAQPRLSLYLVVLTRPGPAGTEVLLCQRDDSGIWPNLWFVPSFDTAAARKQWLQTSGLPSGKALAEIDHVLSHRRLRLQGQAIALEQDRQAALDALRQTRQKGQRAWRWVALSALEGHAHPRALTKLLAAVTDQPGERD
jgi:A/G-specific adenine glycosylase